MTRQLCQNTVGCHEQEEERERIHVGLHCVFAMVCLWETLWDKQMLASFD
jgi:hypothetical protein